MRNEIKTWNGQEIETEIRTQMVCGWKQNASVGTAVIIRSRHNEAKEAVIDSETENYFRVAGRLFSKKDGIERGGNGELFVASEKLKHTFAYYRHRNKIESTKNYIEKLEKKNVWAKREQEDREKVKTATIERVENITPTYKVVRFSIAGRNICEVVQSAMWYTEGTKLNPAEVSMSGTRYEAEYAELVPVIIAEAFKLCAEWNQDGEAQREADRIADIAKREQSIEHYKAELMELEAIK